MFHQMSLFWLDSDRKDGVMKRAQIGDAVRLTKSMAESYINHQEFFYSPSGRCDSSYDDFMVMAILAYGGFPVVGVISGFGSRGSVKVVWNYSGQWAYYDIGKDVQFFHGALT